LAKKKPTQAEIELQLSERRFLLEMMSTAASVLQVPIVTAFVWYYLSRTNAGLGALNKAILAAELAPIVGDIQFPPGVLLGAAMESSEDFLNILDGAGILDADKVKEAALEGVEDTGDILGGVLVGVTGLGKGFTCQEQESAVFDARTAALEEKNPVIKAGNTIAYGLLLKSLKTNGCDRPGYILEEKWREL
jgi:hypothetical protein